MIEFEPEFASASPDFETDGFAQSSDQSVREDVLSLVRSVSVVEFLLRIVFACHGSACVSVQEACTWHHCQWQEHRNVAVRQEGDDSDHRLRLERRMSDDRRVSVYLPRFSSSSWFLFD